MPQRSSARFVSLRTKLASMVVLLLSSASLVVYLELVEREWQSLVRAKMHAASMVSDLLAASLVAPLDFGDRDAVEKDLEHLKQNGDVVYASVKSAGEKIPVVELHPDARITVNDEAHFPASPATTVISDRVVATRIVTDPMGQRLGSAVVHFSLLPERSAHDAARWRILWVSIALTIGIGAIFMALSQRLILSPLERLVVAARRVEEGHAARVEVRAHDELGRLGHGFNAMAEAILDREHRLAHAQQRLQELFDHMRQAIVVFGPDGTVEAGASRQAEVIFGKGSLEGRSIRDVLYPAAPAHDVEMLAFEEWRETLFICPGSSMSEIASLAPDELTLPAKREGEKERVLALELRPILQDEKVRRVMLLATDVTETRSLARAVAAGRQEHARQMASMRRLVAGGAHQFAGFTERTTARLSRSREAFAAEILPRAALRELLQHVHTIRGEARSFDLDRLEAEAASIENVLTELHGKLSLSGLGVAVSTEQRAEILLRIDGAIAQIQAATEQFVEASPIGRAVLDQITVRRSDVTRLLSLAGGRDDELGHIVERIAARPFGEFTAQLADTVPLLAERAGKRVRLQVEGREVQVPTALNLVLPGTLAHLIRNAVAHGIERKAERERRGKDPIGKILLACSPEPRGPRITVEDDGAGLDLDRIRERAQALGLPVPTAGVAALVFADGLSTAEEASDLAGHGVGLAAVASDLDRAGFEITVWTERSKGTRFTLEQRPRA